MFHKYHKINSLYKRDLKTGQFLIGQYSTPEFEYLRHNEWLWDEKIDGTNIRVTMEDGALKIGGRTDRAQIPAHLVTKLYQIFSIEKLNEVFGEQESFILFGEGCGAKIQKNGGAYVPDGDVDFVLFDVQIGRWWLRRDDVIGIAAKLNLRSAPPMGSGTLDEAEAFVRQGFMSKLGDRTAEGIVLRPKNELFARNGERIITKLKIKDFIDKNGVKK